MSADLYRNLYRVKTPHGYWHLVGGGRYGRVEGAKADAWLVCKACADEVVAWFWRFDDSYRETVTTELVTFDQLQRCQACDTKGSKR